jgi:hypothetical protein
MNFAQAQHDILAWIVNFVEQPNTGLNNWAPCPYARAARVGSLLNILPGSRWPRRDLSSVNLMHHDVVAYVYDANWFAAENFEFEVDQANRDFLVPQNVIALTDHPDSPEIVNGVVMNQGTYAIVFVQSLSKVNHFARLLANRGYYDSWPEQYLTDLFAHREDPRFGI